MQFSLLSKPARPDSQISKKYIFDQIITCFGKDLKDSILGVFTHDDEMPPGALEAFRVAKIGLASHFR
jgi:hypothetical protein